MTSAAKGVPLVLNRSMAPGSIIPVLGYPDVAAAARWLCAGFGFAEGLRIGDHRVQLVYGDGSPILTNAGTGEPPQHATQSVMIRGADADAHCQRTSARGARVVQRPIDHAYGERQYTAEDPWGRRWTFSQSIADADPAAWGGVLVA